CGTIWGERCSDGAWGLGTALGDWERRPGIGNGAWGLRTTPRDWEWRPGIENGARGLGMAPGDCERRPGIRSLGLGGATIWEASDGVVGGVLLLLTGDAFPDIIDDEAAPPEARDSERWQSG
ncbi:unnamed protein product, partial [marine sediment metagenome]